MKKVILSLLCFFLIFLLLLPCAALSLDFWATDDYYEYRFGLKVKDPPDNFIEYKQIASIGTFEYFYSTGDKFESYYYRLRNSYTDKIYFDCVLTDNLMGQLYEPLQEVAVEDAAALTDMRTLKESAPDGGVYIDVGDLQYVYYNRKLMHIQYESGDILCRIYVQRSLKKQYDSCTWDDRAANQMLYEYPLDADTVIAGLLNYHTAEDTLDELKEDMAGDHGIPAEEWSLIGVSMVCIVVIVAMAISIALLIRRKKKKAASVVASDAEAIDAGAELPSDAVAEEGDSIAEDAPLDSGAALPSEEE